MDLFLQDPLLANLKLIVRDFCVHFATGMDLYLQLCVTVDFCLHVVYIYEEMFTTS